jgi:hypothetical protein
MRMQTMSNVAGVIALAVLMAACAGPNGATGNDTGGIIPWSPENQLNARALAQAGCDRYGKLARLTSSDRRYGGYIAYRCVFDGPLRRRVGRG